MVIKFAKDPTSVTMCQQFVWILSSILRTHLFNWTQMSFKFFIAQEHNAFLLSTVNLLFEFAPKLNSENKHFEGIYFV